MALYKRATIFIGVLLLLFLAGCASRQGAVAPTGAAESKVIDTPAMHMSTMRPYTINGKIYYPTVVEVGSVYEGLASWYGPNFHGKKTSNGEVYDMYAMTAAHKTFPMNTMVKVTNLKNGKAIVVRINDRGPFVEDRIIDLSYSAVKSLGMLSEGVGPVRLEVLGFDNTIGTLAVSKQQVEISDFSVQIGSFRKIKGAQTTQERNALVDGRYKAVTKTFDMNGEPIYRVWLTGFRSEAEARDFIAKSSFEGAFVVRD